MKIKRNQSEIEWPDALKLNLEDLSPREMVSKKGREMLRISGTDESGEWYIIASILVAEEEEQKTTRKAPKKSEHGKVKSVANGDEIELTPAVMAKLLTQLQKQSETK